MRTGFRIGIAAALLAGCAAGAYKVPEGPQTARLTVTNASGEVLALYTYENAESCAGLLALHPRAGVPIGDSFTVRVAGGAPFTLTAKGTTAPPGSFGTGGGAPCEVAGTFVPVAGASYLAIYRVGGGQCFLQVGVRATGVEGPAKYNVERSFRRREESACR